MVLVDTSVWVSHLRKGNTELADLLQDGEVVSHPFVVGELACGNLKKRALILSLLKSLPMSIEAEHEEVLAFVERNRLAGKGLGYVTPIPFPPPYYRRSLSGHWIRGWIKLPTCSIERTQRAE
jgi:predicted nucleic acid-binding protein